ncbi:MAG: GNAT family N-acetyltransferase [Lutibacter sp.]
MLQIFCKSFSELSKNELYRLLKLRSEVFVVEQNCVYQDIDGKDQKALHILGYKNKKLIAYTRLFKSGDYFKEASIGRVVVAKNERNHDYGHEIIKASIKAINDNFIESKITISAQEYLQKFYESHGFKKMGNGIPHIKMINF